VIRRMNRVIDEPGVNRVAWDLRLDQPAGGGGGRGGGGGAGGRGGAAAQQQAGADTSLAALRARRRAAFEGEASAPADDNPFAGGGAIAVLPGTYTVTVIVEGKRYSKNVEVTLDPRSDMTVAQQLAQYTSSLQIQDVATRVNRIINAVDDLTRQMTSLQDQLRRVPRDSASGAVQQALAEADGALKELKQFKDSVLARPLPGLGYRQYPRLREEVQTVSGMISRPMMPPTAGEMTRFGELTTETSQAQTRLDGIIERRVVKINDLLKGTPHVLIQTPARTFVP
jgi:hypothetical protein